MRSLAVAPVPLAWRCLAGEQLGRRSPSWLILEINEGERLAVVVANDKAGVVEFFNRPRWREATRGGMVKWKGHSLFAMSKSADHPAPAADRGAPQPHHQRHRG